MAQFSGDLMQIRHRKFGVISCDNLHLACGLGEVTHKQPSCLDTATLRASVHCLPDTFLQHCGLSDLDISQQRNIFPGSVNAEV